MKVGTMVLMVLMALMVVPMPSFAQAFKCKTPSGTTVISDSPCTSGARTERVQANEYISPERQRQAQTVYSRNTAQVNEIEREKSAYGQQLQRQQATWARADAEQARINAERAAEQARIDAIKQEAEKLKYQKKQLRSDDWEEPQVPPPLSIIKNCNGATCTDQSGQRYTTEAGKTVRSDGKRCYQQGSAMYCD